eukprot:scaffold20279_cov52-Phaeocystis_antarctica.AAC.5
MRGASLRGDRSDSRPSTAAWLGSSAATTAATASMQPWARGAGLVRCHWSGAASSSSEYLLSGSLHTADAAISIELLAHRLDHGVARPRPAGRARVLGPFERRGRRERRAREAASLLRGVLLLERPPPLPRCCRGAARRCAAVCPPDRGVAALRPRLGEQLGRRHCLCRRRRRRCRHRDAARRHARRAETHAARAREAVARVLGAVARDARDAEARALLAVLVRRATAARVRHLLRIVAVVAVIAVVATRGCRPLLAGGEELGDRRALALVRAPVQLLLGGLGRDEGRDADAALVRRGPLGVADRGLQLRGEVAERLDSALRGLHGVGTVELSGAEGG